MLLVVDCWKEEMLSIGFPCSFLVAGKPGDEVRGEEEPCVGTHP